MASIIRLDKPKNSPQGTHGWQVRGRGKRGYHSKLFSDGQYGGSEPALAAAKAYLESYVESHPSERDNSHQPYHQGLLVRLVVQGAGRAKGMAQEV